MRESFNSSIPFSPTRFSDVLPAPIGNWISPKVLPWETEKKFVHQKSLKKKIRAEIFQ
jgi:hypothetical protein